MAEHSDRLLLISPHYDDGIFSCGALLSARDGTTVATVFSGTPTDEDLLTGWDRDCGFASSAIAMREREREDDAALELVGAEGVRLGFFDAQYVDAGVAPAPALDNLAIAIERAIDVLDATTVLIPLGLYHSDHDRVHQACMRVFEHRQDIHWLAYEDALYRRMPGGVQARLAALHEQAICATPAFPSVLHGAPRLPSLPRDNDTHWIAKREAVAAYESQLRAFGPNGHGDLCETEHYWHLSPVEHAERHAA